jgi:hypothetical protein
MAEHGFTCSPSKEGEGFSEALVVCLLPLLNIVLDS